MGISGNKSYEDRKEQYKESLKDSQVKGIVELAKTTPGGDWDAPFAPIDPALNAAAAEILREAGLEYLLLDY